MNTKAELIIFLIFFFPIVDIGFFAFALGCALR